MGSITIFNYFFLFGGIILLLATLLFIYKKVQIRDARVISGKVTDVKIDYLYSPINRFYPVVGIYQGRTLIHTFKAKEARAQFGFYDIGDMIEVYEIQKNDKLKFKAKKGYYRTTITLFLIGLLLIIFQFLTIKI
jgi:hypothetical protein